MSVKDMEIVSALKSIGFRIEEIRAFQRPPAGLRDEFAKAALVLPSVDYGVGDEDRTAELAYRVADAMMKERLKNA